MNQDNELYIHRRYCAVNFQNALILLEELKLTTHSSLIVNAAFQFALIEYSKPYKVSHGAGIDKRKGRKYQLSDEFIPYEHKELHERIVHYRDQFFAHSDQSIREPKLIKSKSEHYKNIGIVDNYINGFEEFKNIDQIIDLIGKTLENVMKDLEASDQQIDF